MLQGHRTHPGKSKVIKVKTATTSTIIVLDKGLEEVDTFTYLGSGVAGHEVQKRT